MKYQPPFKYGATPAVAGIHNDDADASYVNGDPATGTEGSVPPAEAWEHPQREILKVITEAGLTPDHTDLTQLWQALQLLYGNASSNFRNLLIFPEALTADGKLAVNNNGGGTLELAPAQNFLWRGWISVATDDIATAARQVTTIANKTYHVRWHASGTGDATPGATYPKGRVVLKDLADAGYNPTAAAETNAGFDTTYDDILLAKVVTDGANVPTITPLVNLNRLYDVVTLSGAPTSNSGANGAYWSKAFTLDWARTPIYQPSQHEHELTDPNPADSDFVFSLSATTRYGATLLYKWDGAIHLAATVSCAA